METLGLFLTLMTVSFTVNHTFSQTANTLTCLESLPAIKPGFRNRESMMHRTGVKSDIHGKSHYWGEIYVSLSDKQIEYASLTEDVLMDIKEKSRQEGQVKYTVRCFVWDRLKTI